jgi:hypothetical protein
MAVLHHVAHVVAVIETADGTIVAGGQDDFISDDDGAHVLAITGRAARHFARNRHEVFIPACTFSFDHVTHLPARRGAIARLRPWHEALDLRASAWLGLTVILRRMLGWLARRSLASAAFLCAMSGNGYADPAARAEAEAVLSAIEKRPPADRALADTAVSRARHALARATQARNAGDQRHGSELEALALEHAQTGSDLLRTADAEKKLREVEERALEVETRVVRARALVEQAAARRGRAAEQLRLAEAEKAGAVAPASKSAQPTAKPTAKPTPAAKPSKPSPAPAPKAAPVPGGTP